MRCEVLLRLKDGTREFVRGLFPYDYFPPKRLTQAFVRPSDERDCVCTERLDWKRSMSARREMRHRYAFAPMICTGEFLYVETNGYGVPIYDQVP